MGRQTPQLFPRAERLLATLGENIKLARRRRKLTTEQVAERANISRATLWSIEKGAPRTSLGSYLQVLYVLGLEQDILKIANADELGRKLQDAELLLKVRSPKGKKKQDGE